MNQKSEDKVVIGLMVGGYFRYEAVEEMIAAALPKLRIPKGKTKLYRLYGPGSRQSMPGFEHYLEQGEVIARIYTKSMFDRRGDLNDAFLFGAEGRQLDYLLIIGHIPGHYHFTKEVDGKEEIIDTASSIEQCLNWNTAKLEERGIPIFQIVNTVKDDTEKDYAVHKIEDGKFTFSDGVRVARRWTKKIVRKEGRSSIA